MRSKKETKPVYVNVGVVVLRKDFGFSFFENELLELKLKLIWEKSVTKMLIVALK